MFKNSPLLIIGGLSITGFAVGYMVGGSSTPVVSVAIPLLFGLIVTSFGLFQPYKQMKDLPDNISNDHELVNTIIGKIEEHQTDTKKIMGLALIFFSSFYLFGTFIGSSARIQEWFVKNESPGFPWGKDNKPKNIVAALDWITLQKNLKRFGYTKDEIEDLYEIQNTEWANNDDRDSLLRKVALLERKVSELSNNKQSKPEGGRQNEKNNFNKRLNLLVLPPEMTSTAPFSYEIQEYIKQLLKRDNPLDQTSNLTKQFQMDLSNTPETQWSNQFSKPSFGLPNE